MCRDAYDNTLLHIAVQNSKYLMIVHKLSTDRLNVCEWVLKGAPSGFVDRMSLPGDTALICAVKQGNIDIFKLVCFEFY